MSSLTNFNAIILFGKLEEGIAKEDAGLDRKINRGRGCRTGQSRALFCTRKRSGEGGDQVELKEATTGLRTQRPAEHRQRFNTPLPKLPEMSPTSIEYGGRQGYTVRH